MTQVSPPGLPRKRTNYPNGGKQTGPAWAAVWKLLSDAPGPILGEHLAEVGAAAGSCQPVTVSLIVHRFRKAGILAYSKEMINDRWRNVYRQTDRPEVEIQPRVQADWVRAWLSRQTNPRLADAEVRDL